MHDEAKHIVVWGLQVGRCLSSDVSPTWQLLPCVGSEFDDVCNLDMCRKDGGVEATACRKPDANEMEINAALLEWACFVRSEIREARSHAHCMPAAAARWHITHKSARTREHLPWEWPLKAVACIHQ